MATIATKLADARTKVGVKKTGTNSFGKYGYYQIDVIYSEAKEVFKELGIATVERVDMMALEGKVYMKFMLDVINTDDISDKLTFEAITEPNTMKGAQVAQEAGSTITYMTKYLYGLALMIDDGKSDPDALNTHGKTDAKSEPKAMTRMEIIEKINSLPQTEKDEIAQQYMVAENKTSPVDTKFYKQSFLNELVKTKKW